jgi:hypothetical protein
MDSLVRRPGKDLARSPSSRVAGLALINEELAHLAPAMATADLCRWRLDTGDHTYLGCERSLEAKFLDRAKALHSRWLPDYAEAEAAHRQLEAIVSWYPREPITHTTATKMLAVLLGTLSKRKADDDNAAMLLASCADLFNPTNDTIGSSSRLWKPVSKHPVVLALAVKRLIATSKFMPAPSELRDTMNLVVEKLSSLGGRTQMFIETVEKADAIVFTFDRPAWNASYARASTQVPRAMQGRLEDQEPGEDEHGNPIAPSPRWLALNALWEAKLVAEEAAEHVEASESQARIAACNAAPAKRTRKPKRTRKARDEHA